MIGMRILLALIVLAAAVIAALLLFSARGGPAVEPDATQRAAIARTAPNGIGDGTNCVELDPADRVPASTDSRSSPTDPSLDAAADDEIGCRVEIVLLGGLGLLDEAVDIECTDRRGTVLRSVATSVSTWLIADVPPGEYHVASLPRTWQTLDTDPAVSRLRSTPPFVVARFEVAPDERSKRVELTLRSSRELRVRWQALDGRPIVVALAEPGALSRPAALNLFVTRHRLEPGEVVPWLQPASSRFMPNDAMREAGPAWPAAPADGFARIPMPEEGIWFVHACLERNVVESVAIDPGTEEILVRTDVDAVRRWKTRLRFCVVAAETRQPVAGAFYAVDSYNPTPSAAGPDGCVEEERVLPGSWTLTVQAPGRAAHVREITLTVGSELDLGTIALGKSCSVLTLVLAPDGAEATGVDLALVPVARFAAGRGAQRVTWRDRRSIFAVTDEDHVLVAEHPTWAARPLLVEPCGPGGDSREVTLQLEEGVAVTLDFGPVPSAESLALITTAAGLPVVRRTIGPTGLVRLCLVPGDYLVTRPGVDGRRTFRVGTASLVVDLR